MNQPDTQPPPIRPSPASTRRHTARRAWIVAGVADLIQLAIIPLFGGGLLSPANNVLDVVVGFTMVRLFGWHWAFLPTFVAELTPGLDLFPTWTAAVWFVSRRSAVRS